MKHTLRGTQNSKDTNIMKILLLPFTVRLFETKSTNTPTSFLRTHTNMTQANDWLTTRRHYKTRCSHLQNRLAAVGVVCDPGESTLVVRVCVGVYSNIHHPSPAHTLAGLWVYWIFYYAHSQHLFTLTIKFVWLVLRQRKPLFTLTWFHPKLCDVLVVADSFGFRAWA